MLVKQTLNLWSKTTLAIADVVLLQNTLITFTEYDNSKLTIRINNLMVNTQNINLYQQDKRIKGVELIVGCKEGTQAKCESRGCAELRKHEVSLYNGDLVFVCDII